MKTTIFTIITVLLMSSVSFAGGTSTGGTPPAKTLEVTRAEFDNLVKDSLLDKDILIGKDVLRPELLDFNKRTMTLRSSIKPTELILIRDLELKIPLENIPQE